MEEWVQRDIDFSKCKTDDDLYDELERKLDLPGQYGRNLDALWDSVTGIMYTPAYVTIRGAGKVPKSIQPKVEKMIEVFRDAETMYGNVKLILVD